jgi:superfamily II DNA or RNA helicase
MTEQPFSASAPEDVFVDLFCQTFGIESVQYLVPQTPFTDIYGRGRFIDFALQTDQEKFAFEIDSETYHGPFAITPEKWEDDLLRQNSLIYQSWRVFRWTDRQLAEQPDRVQEELRLFLHGTRFVSGDEYLPQQEGAAFAFHDHQKAALDELAQLRAQGKTIAVLTHATGLGKTLVAIADSQRLGLRTLCVAHTKDLVKQIAAAFEQHCPDVTVEIFDSKRGRPYAQIVVATIQSISRNLKDVKEDDFGYLIVDEAHHASAKTYQKIIGFFRTRFMLGLTATPERGDGETIIHIFRSVAHRMDLQTAIQHGLLVPIRCVRVQTNIDMRDVRFNGVRYHLADLETRLVVHSRNQLIVDTYLAHAPNKKAVAFCVNIRHADMLAQAFLDRGVSASVVSGKLSQSERDQRLAKYRQGQVSVLCACDLLNEGWDSPETEVLLMARPTLSRQLYLQQLGRGTRKAEDKESLMVFDFVDNTNQFNRSISLHQIAGRPQYRPGELVLAPIEQQAEEQAQIARGEKPQAFIDLHLWVTDLEPIDIFDWRTEGRTMLSANQLALQLGVDLTTVRRWIMLDKLSPDLTVPLGQQTYSYFKPDRVEDIRKLFKLKRVTAETRKEAFLEFAADMDMTTSYKPVLLQAMLALADQRGWVRVGELVRRFNHFYVDRLSRGLPIERSGSRICAVEQMSLGEIERLIFAMPFEKFERRSFFIRPKEIEFVAFSPDIWRRLSEEDKKQLGERAAQAIAAYYERLQPKSLI